MTTSPHNGSSGFGEADERLLELLVARSTEGLTDTEAAELARLLSEHPGLDPSQFELAAASASLALLAGEGAAGDLPASLRGRLIESAARYAGGSTAANTSLSLSSRPSITSRSPFLGWLAAAAALVLAAIGWWQAGKGTPGTTPKSLETQLAEFVRAAPDAVHWPWSGKEPGYQGVKGEVVWSDKLQSGFMLLSGLPANEPSTKQYQLWIVDPLRDKHPVDGGVFNIAVSPGPESRTKAGEIIVPIVCKLNVQRPAAFALTVEKPGGVVVSDGPLVVVAAPGRVDSQAVCSLA